MMHDVCQGISTDNKLCVFSLTKKYHKQELGAVLYVIMRICMWIPLIIFRRFPLCLYSLSSTKYLNFQL